MSMNQEGRRPFLRSSAREQEASTKQQTSLSVWPTHPVHCGPLSLALACVLTWSRASVSKLLTVILFIICIFISHLWPATASHCHFRFWSFWTLLLPLKKKRMFFKGVKGMWLWRGSYSQRDLHRPLWPWAILPAPCIFCIIPLPSFSRSPLPQQKLEPALRFILASRWVHGPGTNKLGISLCSSALLLVRRARAELEGRLALRESVLSPRFSRADAVLTSTCENLMGLRVLPDGSVRPAASSGTGLQPGEWGSGDRMPGLCHCLSWDRDRALPALGTDMTSHPSWMTQWCSAVGSIQQLRVWFSVLSDILVTKPMASSEN